MTGLSFLHTFKRHAHSESPYPHGRDAGNSPSSRQLRKRRRPRAHDAAAARERIVGQTWGSCLRHAHAGMDDSLWA